MDIIEAIHSENLFRPLFKDLSTWQAWIILLKALFGLPLSRKERQLFKRCTGRRKPSQRAFRELWAIIGRRGGKSFIAAVTAVYLALFYDYKKYLSQGERGVIQVVAADRAQAGVIFKYISAILHSNHTFEQYIQNETKETISLSTSVDIEIAVCSYKSIRGRTVVCAIFDEIAFWRVEGVNPDAEVLAAVRPSMATIANSLLLVLSSPYAKVGVLYQTHKRYYGKNDPDILVWQSETRVMNPTIDKKLIAREMEKDPVAAISEWGAKFRADLETFVPRSVVENCVVPGRIELPPVPGVKYSAFVDPSGGSKDSMTLAIGHEERNIKVLDAIREARPPFSPNQVTMDFAALLRLYKITVIFGDRYGGEWPRERFRDNGILYKLADKPKSDLYRDFLPLLTGRQVELLDSTVLVNQIVNLERRTGRGGRDSIDHPPGSQSFDDVSNCVAGVFSIGKAGVVPRINFVDTGEPAQKPLSKDKPKLKPGEQLIEVYDGIGFCGYEKIGGGPRPWLPGLRGGGGDGPTWL